MGRSGQPRKHDPRADEIRQAIRYAAVSEAIGLIQNGDIDVLDGDSRTPLSHAAAFGNKELVSWLIGRGADVNHQDRNGWSALHLAVQEKHIECVTELLTSGATVDLKDEYGNTALWRATFEARGNYELVRILISHGANPNSKNNANRSPRDFAEQIQDQKLVAALNDQ